MTVQSLVKLDYEFVEVIDEERRLGIGATLILRKDEKEIRCYDFHELFGILNKEMESVN